MSEPWKCLCRLAVDIHKLFKPGDPSRNLFRAQQGIPWKELMEKIISTGTYPCQNFLHQFFSHLMQSTPKELWEQITLHLTQEEYNEALVERF